MAQVTRMMFCLPSVMVDAHESIEYTRVVALLHDILVHAVTLAVPKPHFEVLMFIDASESHWAAVLVHHAPEQIALEVDERDLQPTAFASGRFSGS
jgi:hypothetical protein